VPAKLTTPIARRLRRELPPGAPLPDTLQTLACRWWPFAYLEWCRARLGERFTVYPIDMPPLVFLSNQRDIRAVVGAPADVLHPGAGSAIIAPVVGEQAFILCEEDEHLHARNATVPAFAHAAVGEHAAMVADTVAGEIGSWPLDVPFASVPSIRALALKVVLRPIFAGQEESWISALQERVLAMLSITASFVLQEPQLRRVPGWRSRWSTFVHERAQVKAQMFGLIASRREHGGGPGDLLDALLAASNPDGSPLTDLQLHDHIMAMIVAGHETIAAQLAWAVQLLAYNRSVQERLREEIDACEESGYLEATIRETMRHRPAFLFAIPREVVTSFELAGWTYPAGAHLVPCTYLMHHDPALYPDPQSFRPERFMQGTPKAGAWMPWGAGRKRCVGRHFAILEMQAVLRELISTRVIQPAGDRLEHARWRSAILVPHAGGKVVLRRRTRHGSTRSSVRGHSRRTAGEPEPVV
jgi:cytochrome P450